MHHTTRSHLALLTVSLIYGANYSIAKILLDPNWIGPNAFIFFRVSASALLFLLVVRRFPRVDRRDAGIFLLCSFTGIIGNQLLFFNGLKRTSPIHAALLMVCTPLLVLLFRAVQGTHLNNRQWLGCFLGMAGAAYLIVSAPSASRQQASLAGDLMVFANALLYGYYLLRAPDLIRKYGSLPMLSALFALAVLPVLAVSWQEIQLFDAANFGLREWIAFAFVLIATSFLAYALNAYALKHTNPETVSLYIYLQPLFATLIALASGKDNWTATYLIAACLIFSGIFLSGKKNSPPTQKS